MWGQAMLQDAMCCPFSHPTMQILHWSAAIAARSLWGTVLGKQIHLPDDRPAGFALPGQMAWHEQAHGAAAADCLPHITDLLTCTQHETDAHMCFPPKHVACRRTSAHPLHFGQRRFRWFNHHATGLVSNPRLGCQAARPENLHRPACSLLHPVAGRQGVDTCRSAGRSQLCGRPPDIRT